MHSSQLRPVNNAHISASCSPLFVLLPLQVFREEGKAQLPEAAFHTALKLRLPVDDFDVTDSRVTAGLALRREVRDGDWSVVYLPEEDLPRDPQLRFARLFHVQPLWTKEDITPCVEDLATSCFECPRGGEARGDSSSSC